MDSEVSYSKGRRDFIKTNLAAAMYIAALPSLQHFEILSQHEQPSYKTWERGYSVDNSSLKRFLINTTERPPLDEKTKEMVLKKAYEKALSTKLKDPDNPTINWLPKGDVKIDWRLRNWITFEFDREYAERIIEKSKDTIEDSRLFLESPYLTRSDVRFLIPHSVEDLPEQDNEHNQTILVCYDFKQQIQYRASFHYGKDYAIVEVEESKDSAGIIRRNITVTPRADRVDIKSKREPIFFLLNQSPIKLIETPPIELLHNEVKRYTLDHTKHVLESNLLGGNLKVEDINKAVAKWLVNEELFVHVLGNLWLRNYNNSRNLGFEYRQLEETLFSTLDGRYKEELEKLIRKVNKIGVKQSIELYAEKPERLFG